MPQAIADPDDLERFAAKLQEFENNLGESLSALNAEFGALSESWQDQEQQKFEAEYQELAQSVNRFLEIAASHVPYLRGKAEWLRGYQGR